MESDRVIVLTAAPSRSSDDRLSSIDMLRGFAALAVAVFHGFHQGILTNVHAVKDAKFFLLIPISYGYAGVYLFFVISGFCIHLRWARAVAAGQEPKPSFVSFGKRRLRRLYPAYAAALVIGIALAVRSGTTWTPRFGLDIASHVLLLHNLHPNTLYTINPVFWTLAIEEQLYLLYFLLLWLRQRYGWKTILLVCFSVRLGWHAVSWIAAREGVSVVVGESAQATWFIWVLGALSVEAFYKIIQLPSWARSLPLAALVFASTVAVAFLDRLHNSTGAFHTASLLLEQPGWGIGSFIALNAIVNRESWLHARRRFVLVAPWLWLGLVSYSLYLFHMYVFEGFGIWYVGGVLLAIAAAGVGFALFERPFIRSARRQPLAPT